MHPPEGRIQMIAGADRAEQVMPMYEEPVRRAIAAGPFKVGIDRTVPGHRGRRCAGDLRTD